MTLDLRRPAIRLIGVTKLAIVALMLPFGLAAEQPVGVPNFQWVKVIGRPQYSLTEGHASLLFKAYSVVLIKAPKAAMLY